MFVKSFLKVWMRKILFIISVIVAILFLGVGVYLFCKECNASAYAAFVTALATVVAVIGSERVCKWFFPPKLILKISNLNVERFGSNPQKSKKQEYGYFYLVLQNERDEPAKNVRVLLKRFCNKKQNGNFDDWCVCSPPLQICWSPVESTPMVISINKEQTVDFLRLEQDGDSFALKPLLYVTPNDFEEKLKPGDCAQFELEIVADYFEKIQTFEINFQSILPNEALASVGEKISIQEVS